MVSPLLPAALVFLWFSFEANPTQALVGKPFLLLGRENSQEIRKTLLFDYGWQMKLNHGTYPNVEVIHFGLEEDSAAAVFAAETILPTIAHTPGSNLLITSGGI